MQLKSLQTWLTGNKKILWLSGTALLTFWIVSYWLLPGNSLGFFPFHHDDYSTLTFNINNFLNLPFYSRPASSLVMFFMPFLGIGGYYPFLTFLTFVCPLIVLIFIFRFYERPITVFKLIIFSTLIFSYDGFLVSTKYNLIPDQVAAIFGIVCLFSLKNYYSSDRKRWLLSGCLCFCLSIFAKENYILPVLVLNCYFFSKNFSKKNGWLAWGGLGVGLITLLGQVAFLVRRPVYSDTVTPTSPYWVNLAPDSIFKNFLIYLDTTLASYPLKIAFVAALLYIVFFRRKLKDYFIVAVIIALFCPYLILPNHIYSFYAIDWLPWIIGFTLVLLPDDIKFPAFSLTGQNPQFRKWGKALAGLLLPVLITATGTASNLQTREQTWNYYLNMSTYNSNLVHSLQQARPQFGEADVIGVSGIHDFTPWLNNDGEYLNRNLGFKNSWVLFVPGNDPFYKGYLEKQNKINPGKNVTVLNSTALLDFASLPILTFDEKGNLASLSQGAPKLPQTLNFTLPASVIRAAINQGVYYDSSNRNWQWTGRQAIIKLEKPASARQFDFTFGVPDFALFRSGSQALEIIFDHQPPLTACCFGPGIHKVTINLPASIGEGIMQLEVEINVKTPFVPSKAGINADNRELGIQLIEAGFN